MLKINTVFIRKNLWGFFNNLRSISIKNRLIFFFILVSCIPVVIVGTVSFSYSRSWIVNQASETVGELLLGITRGLDKEFSQIEIISLEMVSSKYIKKTLSADKPANQLEALSRKNTIFSEYVQQKINNRRLINNVILYSCKGYAFSFGKIPDQATEGFEDFELYRYALVNRNVPNWRGTHTYEGKYNRAEYNGILSIARSVNQTNSDSPIGVVEIQLNEKLLRENFREISKEKIGDLLIANADGKVISSLYNEMIGTTLDFDNEKRLLDAQAGTFIATINNQKSLVTYQTMKTTKWKVISIQTYKELVSNSAKVGNITLLVCLLCVAASIVVSIIVTTSIVTPIKRIIYSMDKAENGNFSMKVYNNGSDEIGQLSNKFNSMLDRLNKLFNALALEGKLKKEAELSALQAQITPHFLYNTLNSIRCLAEISNQKQIADMIRSLTILLQNSVNKSDEFITLKEELQLTNHYVLLQKMRFNNLFDIDYKVEEEILNYKTLKFLLQPLIENSIIHGFKSMEEGGKIFVRGYKNKDKLVIEIEDNGNGMEHDEFESILKGSLGYVHSKFSGIGVRNVNDRIQLFFGDNYGLSYETELGKGTKVIIKIPILT